MILPRLHVVTILVWGNMKDDGVVINLLVLPGYGDIAERTEIRKLKRVSGNGHRHVYPCRNQCGDIMTNSLTISRVVLCRTDIFYIHRGI